MRAELKEVKNGNIEQVLSDLNVHYAAVRKYWTGCPKCSSGRKKKGTKTLGVFIEDGSVSLYCLHDTCEWHKKQVISFADVAEVKPPKIISIEDSDDLSFISADNKIYRHRNANGETRMLVVRSLDKRFTPIVKTENGDWAFTKADETLLFWCGNRDAKQVVIVEGEKTAESLYEKLGSDKVAVVTWAGGADSVQRGDWKQLDGKDLIIWGDNDDKGQKAVQQIFEVVNGSRVRICDVSSLPAKGDAADVSADECKRILKESAEVSGLDDAYDIDEYANFVLDFKAGPPIGYKEMDEKVKLPNEGVIVISGRSGHGKSTAMCNFIYQLLKNTNKKVVFFTMELTQEQVVHKLINIISLDNGRPAYDSGKELLGESFNWLKGKIKTKQLEISAGRKTLQKIIRLMERPQYREAMIFLDYVQIIPTESKFGEARYKEIQNQVYLLKDKTVQTKATVFLGSQLTVGLNGPDSDTSRESGDINNVADVHFRVWNKRAAKASGALKIIRGKKGEEDEERDYYDEFSGNTIISVIKNRWGMEGFKFGFNLDEGVFLNPCLSKKETTNY